MRRQGWFFRIYCFLIAFSAVGMVASSALNVDPGPVRPIVSVLTMVFAVLVVAGEVGSWVPLAFTAIVASCLEILSLFIGFPFGFYEYTSAWVPTVPLGAQRFPLLLPLAWCMVAWGSYIWVKRFSSGWAAVVLAAITATIIDLPMERAMTDVLEYWKWQNRGPLFGAPLTNAIGWFLTSFLVLAPFRKVVPPIEAKSPLVLSLFCAFLALAGAVAFWDWAWLLLSLFSLTLASVKSMPSKPHPVP